MELVLVFDGTLGGRVTLTISFGITRRVFTSRGRRLVGHAQDEGIAVCGKGRLAIPPEATTAAAAPPPPPELLDVSWTG